MALVATPPGPEPQDAGQSCALMFGGHPGASSPQDQGGGPAHPIPCPVPSLGLPLVEKEDIDGAHRGHDPDQPTHMGGPGAQLPKVQPEREPRAQPEGGYRGPSPSWEAREALGPVALQVGCGLSGWKDRQKQ